MATSRMTQDFFMFTRCLPRKKLKCKQFFNGDFACKIVHV